MAAGVSSRRRRSPAGRGLSRAPGVLDRRASPTGSSTTGPAPSCCNPRSARPGGAAHSGATPTPTWCSSRSSSGSSTPACRCTRPARPSSAFAARGDDLTTANLVIDDRRSVLAHSGEEIIDLLHGGQTVLNIVPLGGVVSELAAAITDLGLEVPPGADAAAAHPPVRSGAGPHPAVGVERLTAADARNPRDRRDAALEAAGSAPDQAGPGSAGQPLGCPG